MKFKDFPYEHFDRFVEEFLKKHQSFLSDKEIELSPEKLLKEYAKIYWNLSENDKDQVKFDELSSSIESTLKDTSNKEILNHAIWLWGYPNSKKAVPIEIKGEEYHSKLFTSSGVASAGPGYVQYKTRGVLYCLYLINSCWESGIEDIKGKIENIILEDLKKGMYTIKGNEEEEYITPRLVCNLLLHLVNHDKYEPIATDRDKELIRENFKFLFANDESENRNNDLKVIRSKLKENGLLDDNETFYENKKNLGLIWRSFSNSDLSLSDMLRIKKAVILYGPPGTGKTYIARKIAKQLYIQTKLRNDLDYSNDKNEALYIFKKFFTNQEEQEEYISVLQFHINYNYEDFMVGQTIKGNEIVIKPGYIFDVIRKANENKDRPHIVILDEINRTDISRVFGELFSALEYRNKPITLPYKVEKGKEPNGYEEFFRDGQMFLEIPENLYFIGTMNEIDFSLERVDFALRRRFLWEYAGYNEDALQEMLENIIYKSKKDISDYIQSCTNLNEVISNDPNLGKKYEIGHAFFNISEELWKQSKGKIGKAKNILWQISILPTLEAYCGSMDENSKKDLVQKCKDAFINEITKNGKQKN